MPKKRCWDTTIGDKSHILCTNDSVEKRKKVQSEVNQHLQKCEDAYLNDKLTRKIDTDKVQYSVQIGTVKKVRCARRRLARKCRMTTIQRDKLEVCTDDPLDKKIDVLDTVDSVLMGCSEGNFQNADGTTFSMYQSRKGLDAVDRNYIGRQVINGEVTSVTCIKRVAKRQKKEKEK